MIDVRQRQSLLLHRYERRYRMGNMKVNTYRDQKEMDLELEQRDSSIFSSCIFHRPGPKASSNPILTWSIE